MVFKCKMCGGSLDLTNNPSVMCCEYCGTKQTLPKLETNKRENLYDRAGHFRRNNDYDKAMQVYEQILTDDPHDAECFWSLILCKYGIEYVQDPATGKRIPTVNRTQTTSVFADEDYKSAIKYADESQREVYEQEAQAIDDIQKGILEISRKEKPFDVFICYKETDERGARTHDSVLANDLYHGLTQEGFKVFFSRITLEDKLGTAYEPYIYAALTTAKIMVVLGTCPEHFNAVWVKNEWSRFLTLTKTNKDKMLIPAFRNMDPYYLPKEFSHLQAQDMSKLGFMQDLIRGIKKILQPQSAVQQAAPQAPTVQSPAGQTGESTAPIIKRMFMFIEDGDFERADEYAERVLDVNPENAHAYLGKLLIEHKLNTADELAALPAPFDSGSSYRRMMMYADSELKEKIEGYLKAIETNTLNEAYNSALSLLENAKTENEYEEAAQAFAALGSYKDSAAKKEEAEVKEAVAKQKGIALNAAYEQAQAILENAKTADECKRAAQAFAALGNFKDSAAKKQEAELKQKEIGLNAAYEQAQAILANAKTAGEYEKAAQAFAALGNYNDSAAKKEEAERKAKIVSSGNIIAIAAGDYHTVGLKKDGTCVAVGYNSSGQCDVSAWKDIIAVSAGGVHTVGLKADGTCVAVGYNSSGQCDVSAWKDIIAVSAGGWHTVGLKKDGTCVAVGSGSKCNVSAWKDVIAVSAGDSHTVGLKKDGTCVAVGSGSKCDVSAWKDIIAVSAGYKHTVGLKSDGTCVAVGYDEDGKCDVSAWKDIIAVSAGGDYTVGLKSDGTCVAVGKNDEGQCDVSSWGK